MTDTRQTGYVRQAIETRHKTGDVKQTGNTGGVRQYLDVRQETKVVRQDT